MSIKGQLSIVLMTTTLGWGGTEGHVTDLASGFVARGIYPIIVVDKPPFNRINILGKLGVEVKILMDKERFSLFDYRKSLISVLSKLNPSLVHLNIWERRPTILNTMKYLGIPVVETLHTTIVPTLNLKTKIRYFISQRREMSVYKKTLPSIINVSDISLGNFQKIYPFIKNTVRIYCGAYFPKDGNNIICKSSEIKVLWIGSLIKRKRPVLALEIWKRIIADFPGARLIMVGDGPEKEVVKELIENMPTKSVELYSDIPDLYGILRSGHIMLHTSVSEGLPKNIRYALNFGIPVVATDVGAISEAVIDGKNGFVVKVNDALLMENRLRELMSNAVLRNEMGIFGRGLGNSLFRLDCMVDNVLNAYNEFYGIKLNFRRMLVENNIASHLD